MTATEPMTPAADRPFAPAYLPITLSILALVTIVAFEAMAVSTAMPTVARDLGEVRSYGFAFSVMLTAQLLGIVVAGVWVDRSGPIPGTFIGQMLLGLGSALCGMSTRFDVFLIGRGLTGLGGGLLVVMLYVIVGRIYPEEMRPKVFTYVSAAWVLPALLGAPIAAWLTSHLSWRWVFWMVVPPIVLTMIVLRIAQRRLNHDTLEVAVSGRDHSAHVRAAWAGVGIALAAGALQYGTHELAFRWSAKTVIAAAGIIGVAALAPVLLPRGTWLMARGLPSVILARALFTASFFGGVTYVPLFLVGQRGASLQMAGLALAAGSLGWAAGAWYQGHDKLHLPRHRLIELGATLLTVGLVVLAAIAWLNIPSWLSVFPLILAGLAMGLGVTTTTVLALELSPLEDHASASSSLQLSDVLGSVLGIAGASAAFAALHVAGRDNHLFGGIFVGLAVVAALAIPAGQRSLQNACQRNST